MILKGWRERRAARRRTEIDAYMALGVEEGLTKRLAPTVYGTPCESSEHACDFTNVTRGNAEISSEWVYRDGS